MGVRALACSRALNRWSTGFSLLARVESLEYGL